jgi:CubicO group peptidase (beta-lactamase class C family)
MGFVRDRLDRMHAIMAGHVAQGELPGLVTLVSRHGETHVDAIGKMALGGGAPMQRDTIFRIASMTKPITAVAAMLLVESCVLRLDDPVDAFLPELANRRVLRSLGGPLDDTVPANRAITLRDLLTFQFGLGAILAPPGTYPIQAAMDERGLAPGPDAPELTPDGYMQRLGELPLVHQPGEGWLYHTGSDVLGVLIARATGQSLERFLKTRIFEPLGMHDTGFHVPPAKLHRLPPCYRRHSAGFGLEMAEGTTASRYSAAPHFASGGGGLVSTADDYLAFLRMLLNRGVHDGAHFLSRPSVALMTSDRVPPAHRAASAIFFGEARSWGFGLSVAIARDDFCAAGRFGWDGGRGTSAYADPQENFIGILLTQRMMDSPRPPPAFSDFWTSAYAALGD